LIVKLWHTHEFLSLYTYSYKVSGRDQPASLKSKLNFASFLLFNRFFLAIYVTLLVGEKLCPVIKLNNQASQLAGKAYEASDYTIVIAVVH